MSMKVLTYKTHMLNTRFLKVFNIVVLNIVLLSAVACTDKNRDAISTETSVVRDHLHDTTAPKVSKWTKSPTVLVFSKTNAWRHNEGIAAADLHFVRLAQKFNYGIFTTANGAIFNDVDLKRFDVIVFNNATGDVLSKEQEQSFERWLTNGGAWIGLHGAGDHSQKDWQWYQSTLIGPKFIGHPNNPHLQQAKIVNLATDHPVMKGIPESWFAYDEWYSFDDVPQSFGLIPLAGLDESTYKAVLDVDTFPAKGDLRMGNKPDQHPVIWTKCIGKGRAVYSALGHHDRVYNDKIYSQILDNAFTWITRKNGENDLGCKK